MGPSEKDRKTPCLAALVKWPTPTVCGNHNRKGASPTSGDGLATAVSKEGCSGGPLNPTWVELLMGWPEKFSCVEPISHVKYLQWLMENCNDEEARVREVLRVLRCGHAAEEVSRTIGRPVGFREAAVLLADLCEHANRPDQAWVFMACAEALESDVRGMWTPAQASGASHKSGHPRQSTREHSDALQALSRLLAHYGKAAWQDGSWENAVPRVARKVADGVDRLKGLGNGQVPAMVPLAWETLTAQPDLFASAGPVA
jgi:hypothetical protein